MISERLIQEETLEGPAFEALFNQRLNEDQYEGPSVQAGIPDTQTANKGEQAQLPMSDDTYQISPQLPPPHSHRTSA
jgi:cell division protease FtsH